MPLHNERKNNDRKPLGKEQPYPAQRPVEVPEISPAHKTERAGDVQGDKGKPRPGFDSKEQDSPTGASSGGSTGSSRPFWW